MNYTGLLISARSQEGKGSASVEAHLVRGEA